MVSSFCLAHWVQFHRGPPVRCGDSGYIKQTVRLRKWYKNMKPLGNCFCPWSHPATERTHFHAAEAVRLCLALHPTLAPRKRQSALKLFPEFPREIWTRADIKAVKICSCRSMNIMLTMMCYGDWRSRGQVPVPQQVLMSLLWGSDLSSLTAATPLLPQQSTASSSNITASGIFWTI